MHYDHISFHLNEDYPADLPRSHAAHHIGYYYAWAVSQNLNSAAAAALPDFELLKSGNISGAQFILEQLGGGIDETCFNETGNRFTLFYYDDEEDGYGMFIEDYFLALNIEDENGFYRTENTQFNQNLLNRVFQTAFERWQASLK